MYLPEPSQAVTLGAFRGSPRSPGRTRHCCAPVARSCPLLYPVRPGACERKEGLAWEKQPLLWGVKGGAAVRSSPGICILERHHPHPGSLEAPPWTQPLA